MSFTLGQLSVRLAKTDAGRAIDRLLLIGAINDAYEEIGQAHPWMRLEDNDSEIVLTAIYETGTISVTEGSNAVELTGGTFTTGMTGRRIRVNELSPYYIFTFVDSTHGTLSRVYEDETDSAASFKLFQAIYSLPPSLEVIESIKSLRQADPLIKTAQEWLDHQDAQRIGYGPPRWYAPFEDLSGVQRIEVYPAPEESEALILRHTSKFSRLTAQSETFLDWVPQGLLFAAAMTHLGSADHADSYERQLLMLINQDNRKRPIVQIRMAPEFTAHRDARRGDDLTEARKRLM